MMSQNSQHPRILTILTVVILTSLVAVIIVQQARIRRLEHADAEVPTGDPASIDRRTSARAWLGDASPADRDHRRRDTRSDLAGQNQSEPVEKQLAEISAPLVGDMASTMFNADVRTGQSVVTGGYRTADGRNQFTILKPRIVTDRNGGRQIEIDSSLIAMSQDDTKLSGLDSLATNAKNTLQHLHGFRNLATTCARERQWSF